MPLTTEVAYRCAPNTPTATTGFFLHIFTLHGKMIYISEPMYHKYLLHIFY
uniref:Uncharacterized protein n=1 Tax=Arion vulgaris TaxID=1028688 RepID=A0A0B7AQ99_9EUPU